MDKLDESLENFTIEMCDMYLSNHDNCAGCYCYLGEFEDNFHCVLDRARIAVHMMITETMYGKQIPGKKT